MSDRYKYTNISGLLLIQKNKIFYGLILPMRAAQCILQYFLTRSP